MSLARKKVRSFGLAAFAAGVAEANRRERGNFDGLLGQIPGMPAGGGNRSRLLVADILIYLRNYLLERQPEDALRALLDEHVPSPGYRNVTPVPAEIALAMGLLNSIGSAARCTGQQFGDLFFGVRDTNKKMGSLAGSKKGGEAKAEAARGRHSEIVRVAKHLETNSVPRRSWAGILARRFKVSATTIRIVLKKAQVA